MTMPRFPANLPLTIPSRIFFPPVRGFLCRFPHYAYDSAKRLQDALAALSAAYPFGFAGQFCARGEIRRGCGLRSRNLRLGFVVNRRKIKIVN
jgi:hypothetical protein